MGGALIYSLMWGRFAASVGAATGIAAAFYKAKNAQGSGPLTMIWQGTIGLVAGTVSGFLAVELLIFGSMSIVLLYLDQQRKKRQKEEQ